MAQRRNLNNTCGAGANGDRRGATCDEDMRDDRSVISMPEGWTPREQPTVERSADVPAAPKSRVAGHAAQRPGQGHYERPLTDNERRALCRATRQRCALHAMMSLQGCVCSPCAIIVGILNPPGP